MEGWLYMAQHKAMRLTGADLSKVPRYRYLLPRTRPMRASHRPCWWCRVTPLYADCPLLHRADCQVRLGGSGSDKAYWQMQSLSW